MLLLEHPKLAARDCSHCLKYDYNQETGDLETDPATGEPIERDPEFPAPCRMHAAGKRATGCPKGTPEEPKALTPQNKQAYEFYKECEATNSFPLDPIVRRWAAIIRAVEDAAREAAESKRLELALMKARLAGMGG